jgi:thiosulfate/3-mercaptopyruvate sulfurtransferase
VVSVRTWKEHTGLVSGYNYIGPAGRIAGDVWENCGSAAYHMQDYRDVDNTMRAYPEIAANWEEAGITPKKRIAVYDGGWFEWSQDPINNPIEIGEPQDDEVAA